MKRILPIFIIMCIILIISFIFISMTNDKKLIVVRENNLSQVPLDIILGKYQDSDCGMTIHTLEYASQVISSDGKTWFFHDHGGMLKWLKDKSFKDSAKIWVMTKDTKKYIDARIAYFSTNDKTPMNYGFGAYEKYQDGFLTFNQVQEFSNQKNNKSCKHDSHKHDTGN